MFSSNQEDCPFLPMRHLSVNVIEDRELTPAVLKQLHLVINLQLKEKGHVHREERKDTGQNVWARKFRIGDRLNQGCWENLEARSILM